MLDLYKNIKEKRKERGWTQTDLAQKMGYSDKSMIAKIEAGKVDINQSKIKAFADVFGCSPGELMGWNDSDQDKVVDAFNKTLRDIGADMVVFSDNLEMMVQFEKLSPEHQQSVASLVKVLYEQENNK